MRNSIQVVVIDDHPLFRAGVVQAIELDRDIIVTAEGASVAEALQLVEAHHPHVVLLDVSLPDGSGIDAALAIARLPKPPRILMLTVSSESDHVMRAVEAGAAGYVLKGTNATDLISAIRTVVAGQHFISPTLSFGLISGMARSESDVRLSQLTPQERRILELLSMGLSNRSISEEIGINEKTVKYHLYNAFRKLNVKNRVQASQMMTDHLGKTAQISGGLTG